MKLKNFIILLLLFSIIAQNYITPAKVEAQNHINPTNIERDDQYTYNYFNNFLKKFAGTLNELILNDPKCIDHSREIFNSLEVTKGELLFYETRDVKSPAKHVIKPYYEFSKDLVNLCELDNKLNEITDEKSLANLIILEINRTLENMKKSLDEIDNINALKKGDETLKFDTSEVREYLDLYKKKILKNYELADITALTIDVSNKNPILFENISIFGTGENGSVTVHIDNNGKSKTFNLKVVNNTFSMDYAFEKTGTYKIYATQNNRISNTVYVNVSKIPSHVVIDSKYRGFIGDNIKLYGKLVDAYGKPIKNSLIYLNNKTILVDDNGVFTTNIISEKPTTKYIDIAFKGNETYKPASKTVVVEFVRHPVRIIISADKTGVPVGESLAIFGNIYGLKEPSNVYILIDGTIYKTIKTNGFFTTDISIDASGDYEIWAEFKGNDYYEGCRSNVIRVNVFDNFSIYHLIIIVFLVLLIVSLYLANMYPYLTRKKKRKLIVDDKSEIKEPLKDYKDKEDIPVDVRGAYEYLFNKLVSKYNLQKSLTPRELVNKIKGLEPKIYENLKFITSIHESVVYKSESISDELKEKLFKKLREILDGVNE